MSSPAKIDDRLEQAYHAAHVLAERLQVFQSVYRDSADSMMHGAPPAVEAKQASEWLWLLIEDYSKGEPVIQAAARRIAADRARRGRGPVSVGGCAAASGCAAALALGRRIVWLAHNVRAQATAVRIAPEPQNTAGFPAAYAAAWLSIKVALVRTVPAFDAGLLIAEIDQEWAAVAEETPPRAGILWTRPEPMATWARAFGCHRNTVGKWFRAGIIRNEKVGRLFRVVIEDLPPREQAKHLPPAT